MHAATHRPPPSRCSRWLRLRTLAYELSPSCACPARTGGVRRPRRGRHSSPLLDRSQEPGARRRARSRGTQRLRSRMECRVPGPEFLCSGSWACVRCPRGGIVVTRDHPVGADLEDGAEACRRPAPRWCGRLPTPRRRRPPPCGCIRMAPAAISRPWRVDDGRAVEAGQRHQHRLVDVVQRCGRGAGSAAGAAGPRCRPRAGAGRSRRSMGATSAPAASASCSTTSSAPCRASAMSSAHWNSFSAIGRDPTACSHCTYLASTSSRCQSALRNVKTRAPSANTLISCDGLSTMQVSRVPSVAAACWR